MAGTLAATADTLRRFDEARVAAFQPTVVVPTAPTPPPNDESTTSFASKPADDEFRKRQAEYNRALQKAERDLAKYVSAFEKEWGRLELGPNAKTTRLSPLAPTDIAAACLVDNVEGKCKKTCYDTASVSMRGGWPELIPSACDRRPLPGYAWVYSCRATFECALSSPLSIDKPGINYASGNFKVDFAKQYVGDRAGSEDFQQKLGAIHKCDLVKFPKMSAWKFSKRWVGEAKPEDGWPVVAGK